MIFIHCFEPLKRILWIDSGFNRQSDSHREWWIKGEFRLFGTVLSKGVFTAIATIMDKSKHQNVNLKKVEIHKQAEK